jgi:hypothetical protein
MARTKVKLPLGSYYLWASGKVSAKSGNNMLKICTGSPHLAWKEGKLRNITKIKAYTLPI